MGWQGSTDEGLMSRRWMLQAAIATGNTLAATSTAGSGSQDAGDPSDPSVATADDWIWLGNRSLRVGLLQSSGGAIGWLGTPASGQNLINHFDRGRLVQQSWYGREDGSDWNGRPWRWNPVQGGDWKGKSARITARQTSETTAFIRTQPLHWATGTPVPTAAMEQTLKLDRDILHIRFRFHYSGDIAHPPRHQELPAVFVNPRLRHLVIAKGDSPWTGAKLTRSQPGWPNEYLELVEPWAAWVDDTDWGLGCCVPRIR
ncbi:MAG: hypothetical protein ACKO2P_04260, partial [Planctomycetota bacterium]